MSGKSSLYLITGCSGGGKSTLIRQLAKLGYTTSEEVGRIIVEEEITKGGNALPWMDGLAFGNRLVERTLFSLNDAKNTSGTVFCDRGILDNMAWFDSIGEGAPAALIEAIASRPYQSPIFVLPPWEDIYIQDAVRNKPFEQAVQEFQDIEQQLMKLKWEYILVPIGPLEQRAEFILSSI